jgi:serine protease SohB
VSSERGLFGRRTPGVGAGGLPWPSLGSGFGPGLAEEIVSAIEARAIWARFGL